MTKQVVTFRQLSEQLEEVLSQLQAEDIDIDAALKLHDQGTKLVAQLEERLKTTEATVKQLKLRG